MDTIYILEPDWLRFGRGNVRCVQKMQKEEKQARLEEEIFSLSCEGLCVKDVEGCGQGLFAVKKFLKDDYICVYTGVTMSEAEYTRLYGDSCRERCYTYHFQYDTKKLVIDATEDFSFARMANHSWKKYNARMERVVVRDIPHVVMFASTTILPGHEIRYNYGDAVVKESGDEYEWLREVKDYN